MPITPAQAETLPRDIISNEGPSPTNDGSNGAPLSPTREDVRPVVASPRDLAQQMPKESPVVSAESSQEIRVPVKLNTSPVGLNDSTRLAVSDPPVITNPSSSTTTKPPHSAPTSRPVQTRSQKKKSAQATPARRSTRRNAGKFESTRFGYGGEQSNGYLADSQSGPLYQSDPYAEKRIREMINSEHVFPTTVDSEDANGPFATPADPQAYLSYEDMAEICEREGSGTRKGSMSRYYSYKAATSDPDTLDYDAAMANEHVDEWRKAAQKEIEQLEAHGTWVLDDIGNATSRILPGTWVFKLKRDPDGNPTKFKARYCVRGDLQEGSDNTYAPVTAWPSVRVFLLFAMVLGWATVSIDFSNAFIHAKLDKPLWIHLPRGFHTGKPGKRCLRLKRSLYGTKDAPRLFYECVRTAFEELGFKKSEHDPCFFYKPDMMLVLYVDDVGIAAKNPKDIDRLVESLRKKGFELTQEGSFSEFLGIKITPVGTGLHMTQRGLIDKVVSALGLENCRPNWTPAQQGALGIDPDGPPMKEDWLYPSVVGMLLYLSTNTRPDIAYAVSQVARFNHSPKQSHAVAVKMIGRYLHRTRDYGTIVTPTGDMNLELYVDADFAGLYGRDPARSPSSVRSRTGYIIFLGGIPLVWRSFLQTEISLSTLESEYSSLSNAMRTLIPIRSLVLELAGNLDVPHNISTSVNSTVFEDNNGAMLLANNQRITSRTRYFQVKWHFFWDIVKRGEIKVLYIPTDLQKADFLTKMNPREVFERLRKMVQGW